MAKYMRLTTAARIDCIGEVIGESADFITIRVPNWCADGWHKDFTGRRDEFERSTAKMCRQEAKLR